MDQPGLTATTLLKRLLQASVKATGLTEFEPLANDDAATIFTKWIGLLGLTDGVAAHSHTISDIAGLATSLNAKANAASLATVAFSGRYNDLVGAPFIGPDLTNIEALTSVGIAVRATSAGSWVLRALTAPNDGIALTNANGVLGNPVIVPNHDLAAIEALAATGFAVRTALDAWAIREITLSAELDAVLGITNPAGVAGNPLLDLDTQNANTVFAGPDTGSPAKPTMRALVEADIPDLSSLYAEAGLVTASGLTMNANRMLVRNTAGVGAIEEAVFEEGIFTPTVSFATPGDLSVSYASQIGLYQRVGNRVNYEIRLTFTPTWSTASGDIAIGGLPYTVLNSEDFFGHVAHDANLVYTDAAATMLLARAVPNTTTIALQDQGNGRGRTSLGTGQFATGVAQDLVMTGWFFV